MMGVRHRDDQPLIPRHQDRGAQDHPGPQRSPRRLWWIVATFLAVQVCVIWFAANGSEQRSTGRGWARKVTRLWKEGR